MISMSKDNQTIAEMKPEDFMKEKFSANLRSLPIDSHRFKSESGAQDIFDFLGIYRIELNGGKTNGKK